MAMGEREGRMNDKMGDRGGGCKWDNEGAVLTVSLGFALYFHGLL